LNYGKKEEHIFLGKEIAQHRDFSERTAQEIDEELQKMVNGCFDRAKQLVNINMDALHAIANKLLEKEVLDGQEIDVIIMESTNGKGVAVEG
jgi:cell division protease FtsH